MKVSGATLAAWLLIIPLLGLTAGQATATDLDALGRTDKLRIVVDKVLMAANGWVMTDDHVRQIAEAGFNVVSPRLGNDDMQEVRKIARLARKHGIFHLPWMRGTLTAKTGPKHRVAMTTTRSQAAAVPGLATGWIELLV